VTPLGFYDIYETALVDGAKAVLEQVTFLQRVSVGERFRIERLSMAVMDPTVVPIKEGAVGARYDA